MPVVSSYKDQEIKKIKVQTLAPGGKEKTSQI